MDYKQRVVKEKQDLDSNIGKLHAFIKSGNENVDELHREQIRHMRSYSAVLGQRIAGFGVVEAVEDEVVPVVEPLFRAKLKVLQVIPDGEYETVVMQAVTDGTPEDNSFSKWTPAAELTMAITNPDLHGKIQPGNQFYVDFTEAGVVEVVVLEETEEEEKPGPADGAADLNDTEL